MFQPPEAPPDRRIAPDMATSDAPRGGCFGMTKMFLGHVTGGMLAPWQTMILRLASTLVPSGVIGLECELDGKTAGLRTEMLTGMSAYVYCLIMLSILQSTADRGEHLHADQVRIVEAVTPSVAFLAAGLIVFARGQVRGLTTGAGIWLSGAVGLACGLGLWILAPASAAIPPRPTSGSRASVDSFPFNLPAAAIARFAASWRRRNQSA